MIAIPGARTSRRPTNRLPRCDDDRGSMPMLLIVMIVGMLLGALLVPMIITQDRATRFSTTRVHALDAAQAGIDNVVGRIRGSVDSAGIGTPTGLPCGPITGNVDSTGNAAYAVTIAYYTVDPVANPTTPKMLCSSGFGTYESSSGTFTPSYALITSTGTDGAAINGSTAGRTLVSTYVFKTSNTSIPGGLFRIYPSSTATVPYCMDAGSSTPTAGTAVSLQSCSTTTPPAAQQTFAYNTDLTIELLSSVSTAYPNGLCLDGAASVGASVVLNPCTAFYTQLWSSDDSAHLRGSLSNKSDTSGYCIDVAVQSAGRPLTVQTCAGGVTDEHQTWVPSPNAGSGGAGAAASQLVNYQQFGRCMDVTNQNAGTGTTALPGGGSFIILYSCKQDPNQSLVGSNQRWTANPALTSAPTTGQWRTSLDTSYCLTAPTSLGGYVTTQTCSSALATRQQWTNYQNLDSRGNTLPYATKYTIQNGSVCLSISPNSDVYNGQYYKAITATCDGSITEKWNANPNIGVASLQNTNEK